MEPQTSHSNKNLEQKVEKYIKFFTLKSLQCVIDSRTGLRCNTRCNPTAKGLDWFNISLPDSDANRTFQGTIRELFGKKVPGLFMPVSLDIVLKTSEGTLTVLESWQVSTKVHVKEENMKNHFSIYNRLGVLLKSVISISRVLPSYQLSHRNDSDFVLYFKVHSEIYPLHYYELHNVMHVGSVVTPSGEISIKSLYRNKIWLTADSMLSPSYIINDTSTLYPLSGDKDKSFQILDMFAENEITLAVSDISPCLPDWFSSSSSGASEVSTAFRNIEKQNNIEKHMTRSSLQRKLFDENSRAVPAFAEPFDIDLSNMPNLDLPELPSTPPFLSLLQDSPDSKIITAFLDDDETTDSISNENITSKSESENESPIVQRRAEAVGFEDDFVLVELRPAFCSDNDTVGSLFRQCQSPAALDMFAALEKEEQESETIDLDTQLDKYRKELQEFENYFQVML